MFSLTKFGSRRGSTPPARAKKAVRWFESAIRQAARIMHKQHCIGVFRPILLGYWDTGILGYSDVPASKQKR